MSDCASMTAHTVSEADTTSNTPPHQNGILDWLRRACFPDPARPIWPIRISHPKQGASEDVLGRLDCTGSLDVDGT